MSVAVATLVPLLIGMVVPGCICLFENVSEDGGPTVDALNRTGREVAQMILGLVVVAGAPIFISALALSFCFQRFSWTRRLLPALGVALGTGSLPCLLVVCLVLYFWAGHSLDGLVVLGLWLIFLIPAMLTGVVMRRVFKILDRGAE